MLNNSVKLERESYLSFSFMLIFLILFVITFDIFMCDVKPFILFFPTLYCPFSDETFPSALLVAANRTKAVIH